MATLLNSPTGPKSWQTGPGQNYYKLSVRLLASALTDCTECSCTGTQFFIISITISNKNDGQSDGNKTPVVISWNYPLGNCPWLEITLS